MAKYFEEKDEGDGQTVHNEEQGNSKISERENVYMTHVFRLLADPYLAYGLEACKESQIDYLALATLSYD